MPKAVVRYSVELTALNLPFPLVIPANAEDVALRVLCRYEPEQMPPPPTVVVVAVKESPHPEALMTVTRNFVMVPDGADLPPDFGKYIGAVPFGPDKQLVNIIELLAVNPT